MQQVRYGLGVLMACATGCLAADQTAQANFRVDANVVLINATVVDRNNRPVRGLARDSFRLFEERSERSIVYFGEEEIPLSLAIVFDTSRSMGAHISGARQALGAVLATSNLGDEFSLITFSDQPEVKVPWTRDVGEIQNGVLSSLPWGRTSLLDAVHLAITEMRQSKNLRRAILILSDGGDNHSRHSERELSRLLEEADVQMYAVELSEVAALRDQSPEVLGGPDLLDRLCYRAGGRYFQVMDKRELTAVADQIGKELRSQYLLGYVPASGADDGKFHHVQLKVLHPAGASKLYVYWRRGYRRRVE